MDIVQPNCGPDRITSRWQRWRVKESRKDDQILEALVEADPMLRLLRRAVRETIRRDRYLFSARVNDWIPNAEEGLQSNKTILGSMIMRTARLEDKARQADDRSLHYLDQAAQLIDQEIEQRDKQTE